LKSQICYIWLAPVGNIFGWWCDARFFQCRECAVAQNSF